MVAGKPSSPFISIRPITIRRSISQPSSREEAYQSARHHDWNVQAVEPEQPSHARARQFRLKTNLGTSCLATSRSLHPPSLHHMTRLALAWGARRIAGCPSRCRTGAEFWILYAPELDDFHFDAICSSMSRFHDSAAEAVSRRSRDTATRRRQLLPYNSYYTRSTARPVKYAVAPAAYHRSGIGIICRQRSMIPSTTIFFDAEEAARAPNCC